jgi:hypothetical protein
MKTKLLALAATIGLAIAAPSFAVAATGDQPNTPPVRKLVKPKKGKVIAKLQCAKPIIVKGVKHCPPVKGATPK